MANKYLDQAGLQHYTQLVQGMADGDTIEYGNVKGESGKKLHVARIPDGSVGTSALASSSITTEKYADGSVTYAKLADDVKQAISKPKVGKDIAAYSWDELVEMANDPTMVNEIGYLIGQARSINIAGYGSVDFQLVGIKHHDLASGGKSAMTFMTVLAVDKHQMNSTNTTSGGWANCAMRSWLNSTVYNAFPEYMKDYIKQVKVPYCETSGGTVKTCNDNLFLASSIELTGLSTLGGNDGEQLAYWAQNNNASARKKTLITGGNAVSWWLRSVKSSSTFWIVFTDGGFDGNDGASFSYGVVLCFCI